jgi:hypothetical protein
MRLGISCSSRRCIDPSCKILDQTPYRRRTLEHLLTGDTDHAKQEVAELIASDPENPGGYWVSANIHAQVGDYEQAAEHLQTQIPLMDGDIVDEVALLGHVGQFQKLPNSARF